MAISNERFTTLFLNWWEVTEKELRLSDMERICKDIGMTRAEFIELVSQSGEFIDKDGWTPEPETAEKVNTEDIPIGDTDQAILETALTQIGIPYSWGENPEGGCIFVDEVEDEKTTGRTVAEIYFTKDGEFNGLC